MNINIGIKKNPYIKQVVKYIRSGRSFRQCSEVLKATKETTNLGQIGCTNMSKVIAYARYICAMAYQMIADMLKSVLGVLHCFGWQE